MVQIDYDFHEAMKTGKISEKIFHRKRVKMVLSSLDYRNKKVLDFGCGTGSVLIPLAKRGVDVTGVDISRYCIARLKEYCKKEGISANLIVSDEKHVPIQNDKFDIILLIDVLEHADNTQVIISETKRLLKKNGKVFVTVPWKYHPIVQFKFLRKLLSGRQDIDEALDKPFTIDMVKKMFHEFKFVKSYLAVFFTEICTIFQKV